MSETKTVSELLADRTETLDEKDIADFFVSEKKSYVDRLLDDQPLLLVGSRGVGKSMLLKYAELMSDKEFASKKKLAVYVTFENSLVMERMQAIRGSGFYDPFRQWTFAKIVKDVIAKSEKLQLVTKVDHMLEDVFGHVSLSTVERELEAYIRILENKNISKAAELREEAQKILSSEFGDKNAKYLLDALENANATKELLNKIIDDNKLQGIVLLFDEAAHALVRQQQEDFFTIFKSLRDKRITCKAAVYPAVTHYGSSFDPAHDAARLTIDRNEKDADYISFFTELLRRRIPAVSELWKRLTAHSEIIPTLCYACFGNPRFLFRLVDIFETKRGTVASLQPVCRTFVQEYLWVFHDNTGSRSKSFSKSAELGHKFIVASVVPKLAAQNNRWRDRGRIELSIYFTIASEVHTELKPILEMLSYSGVIAYRGDLKTGQNTTGQLYAVNIAISVAESVLKNDKRTGNSVIKEMALLQRERFTQYTSSETDIRDLLDELSKHQGMFCANCDKPLQKDFTICPYCKAEVSQEKSVYFELINHPIDKLVLSEKLKKRIREHKAKEFKTVGDILNATLTQIDDIYYVGTVRSKIIKGAANEYIAA